MTDSNDFGADGNPIEDYKPEYDALGNLIEYSIMDDMDPITREVNFGYIIVQFAHPDWVHASSTFQDRRYEKIMKERDKEENERKDNLFYRVIDYFRRTR